MIARFSAKLVAMLDSGMALLPALDVIRRECRDKAQAAALSSVCTRIEQGRSLAEALAEHPELFPETMVELIRVGEVTADLERPLRALATFSSLNPRPPVVRFAGHLGSLLRCGVPFSRALQLMEQLAPDGEWRDFLRKLPGTTVADVMAEHEALIPSYVTALVRAGEVRGDLDQVLLDLVEDPVLQDQADDRVRFFHAFAGLLGKATPIKEICDILESLTPDLRSLIDEVRSSIGDGGTLSAALRRQDLPESVGLMVEAAEAHGDLEKTLRQVATGLQNGLFP